MVPDVLMRKLLFMRQLLADLLPYKNASLSQVEAEHYKLERLFELLIAASTDILFHTLAEQNISPTSYRDAFRLAGKHKLIPVELANRLQNAAGMRNILVHLYEEIDYNILHSSIQPTLQDFNQFVAIFSASLPDEK
ncbi:Protein of unknown function DUF86, SO_3166 group [hydrothermal vent metagenome]|uniref:DUF86 domain-containing protein n=1 Tax=hydrothermal vent metagenome TaxID=652676 RepID=A0A3B0V3G8_9ZZZZ